MTPPGGDRVENGGGRVTMNFRVGVESEPAPTALAHGPGPEHTRRRAAPPRLPCVQATGGGAGSGRAQAAQVAARPRERPPAPAPSHPQPRRWPPRPVCRWRGDSAVKESPRPPALRRARGAPPATAARVEESDLVTIPLGPKKLRAASGFVPQLS